MDVTDDVPDLVDSSDEESNTFTPNAEYVKRWERRPVGCEEHVKPYVLAPFLFGFDNHLPKQWLTALHTNRLLPSKHRAKDLTPLSREEWEIVDFVDDVYERISDLLTTRTSLLPNVLDFIDRIDEMLMPFDVQKAVDRMKDSVLYSIGKELMLSDKRFMMSKLRTMLCVIYIFKQFHDHVFEYGRTGSFMWDNLKEKSVTPEKISHMREQGNKAFKENKLLLAVNLYTEAIKKDPLNYFCYGNRAQAYLKLCKYRESLTDSRRSIIINKNWAKGYYRYAEALYQLGMLDKALHINEVGQRMSKSSKDLQEQGDKFKEEKERLLKLKKKESTKKKDLPDLVSEPSDGPESENDEPELITDSDENQPSMKVHKLKKKRETKRRLLPDYRTELSSGSHAVVNGLYSIAATHFQKALDMYTHTEFIRKQVELIDVTVLKYSFGISAVLTVQFKSIMAGIDIFNSLVEDGTEKTFPVAYYGLGKAYVTLNRFPEAVKPIKLGLSASKKRQCVAHHWPQTDIVIPETDPSQFEVMLKDLLHECNYPPTPDAVCRFHRKEDGERQVIYFTDPDFKGFIRVMCHDLCILEFHPNCWKVFKTKFLNKATDKDVLDERCPTPDCSSFIFKILVFRHNSSSTKEFKSDKPPPQCKKTRIDSGKTTLSNQSKIARRAEKKLVRKQKREEAHQLKSREEEEAANIAQENTNNNGNQFMKENSSTELNTGMSIEDMKKASVTVLKKDDEILPSHKTKQKKTKKKKEKSKTILPVEVNFSDNRENHLESEYTIAAIEDLEIGGLLPIDDSQAFCIPPSLQDQVDTFQSQYEEDVAIQNDEVAQNLFIYLEELLTAHGPQEFDSPVLMRELEDFPPEAKNVIEKCNGLRGFFHKSHKFGIMDDYVCVLRDCGKVRLLSEEKRTEYPRLAASGTLGSRFSLNSGGTFSSTGSLASNTSLGPNKPFGSSGDLDVSGFNNSKRDSPECNLNRRSEMEGNDEATRVSPVMFSSVKMKPIKPLVPLTKLKPLTSLAKPIAPVSKSEPLVTTDLNPSALEFKPSIFESNKSNFGSFQSLLTKAGSSIHYDSLDDFALPYSEVSKTVSEKSDKNYDFEHSPSSSISKMNDIDDIPLYDDSKQFVNNHKAASVCDSGLGNRTGLVPGGDQESTSGFGRLSKWMGCENMDDVDDFSDTSSMKEAGCSAGSNPRTDGLYARQEDILPSRSSSRSSNYSDQNSEFRFRTPSPSVQNATTSYSPILGKTVGQPGSKESSSKWSPDRSVESSQTPTSAGFSVSSPAFEPKTKNVDLQSSSMAYSISSPAFEPKTKNVNIQSSMAYSVSSPAFEPKIKNVDLQSSSMGFSVSSPAFEPKTKNVDLSASSSPLPVSPTIFGFAAQHVPVTQPAVGHHRLNQRVVASPAVQNPAFPRPSYLMSASSTQRSALTLNSDGSRTDSTLSPTAGLNVTNMWSANPGIGTPFAESAGSCAANGYGNMDSASKWSSGETDKNLAFERATLLQCSIPRPVGSLPGFGDEPWSKVKDTNEAETQTDAEVMSVGTSTDLDLDLLIEHGKQLQERNEILYVKLQQAEDEKRQMQAVGHKWQNRKLCLEQENYAANQKIGQLEQQTVFLLRDIEQLQNNIKTQKELNESILNQRQTEKSQVEEKEKELRMESERAKTSEMEVLNLRLQLGLQQINQMKHEASFHENNINLFAVKCQKEKQALPVQTRQVLAHWKKVLAKCELKTGQLKAEYVRNVERLQSGTPLNELPPTTVSPINLGLQETPTMMFGQLLPQENSLSSSSSPSSPSSETIPVPASSQRPVTPPNQAIYNGYPQPKPLIPPRGISRPFVKSSVPMMPSQGQTGIQGRSQFTSTSAPSAAPAATTTAPQPTKNSFEKLISVLQSLFPKCNRNQFVSYIQDLRRRRGGSLSGLSLEEIVKCVADTILSEDGIHTSSVNLVPSPASSLPTPPGLTSSWSCSAPQPQQEIFMEEQDPCVICHEELSTSSMVTLDCSHRFHESCVRMWFREQSTCPNCRIHALLPDDFPALK